MAGPTFEPRDGTTILVADDNPENLGVLGKMLESSGFRVRVARDGEQAVRSAQAERPDLVLLDIHMPKMDGYETCRRLKAESQFAEVPVVFISALSDPFNKAEAFELGAIDYIEKPFRFEEVLMRVKNALRLGYYMRRCAELEKELAAATAQAAARAVASNPSRSTGRAESPADA
jgi:DNA-binding response OmpR family regulator